MATITPQAVGASATTQDVVQVTTTKRVVTGAAGRLKTLEANGVETMMRAIGVGDGGRVVRPIDIEENMVGSHAVQVRARVVNLDQVGTVVAG